MQYPLLFTIVQSSRNKNIEQDVVVVCNIRLYLQLFRGARGKNIEQGLEVYLQYSLYLHGLELQRQEY